MIDKVLKLAELFEKYAGVHDDLRDIAIEMKNMGYTDEEIMNMMEETLTEMRVHSNPGLRTEFSELEAGPTDIDELGPLSKEQV